MKEEVMTLLRGSADEGTSKLQRLTRQSDVGDEEEEEGCGKRGAGVQQGAPQAVLKMIQQAADEEAADEGGYLQSKLRDREPGGAAQDPAHGAAQLRHAHRVRCCCIVGAIKGAILQRLNVQVHKVIPAHHTNQSNNPFRSLCALGTPSRGSNKGSGPTRGLSPARQPCVAKYVQVCGGYETDVCSTMCFQQCSRAKQQAVEPPLTTLSGSGHCNRHRPSCWQ